MRPSFKAAIAWLDENDDTDWVVDDPQTPSVTACLVADMFGKTDSEVLAALFAARTKRLQKAEG